MNSKKRCENLQLQKYLTNSNGITLTVLAITIIVMIILVGVILVASVQENGIIARATEAVIESERVEIEELIRLSTVFPRQAAQETYKRIDMMETANAIVSNLTQAKYTVLTKEGNKAERGKDIYNEGEESFHLNIQGKRAKYTGLITKYGLENGLTTVDEFEKIEDPGSEPVPPPEPPAQSDLKIRAYPLIVEGQPVVSTDGKLLVLVGTLGGEFIEEQEAINYVNNKILGNNDTVSLEELDVRLYNMYITEVDNESGVSYPAIQNFEELKALAETEGYVLSENPANDIFLFLACSYYSEKNIGDITKMIKNISDFVCLYRYSTGLGIGETLEYELYAGIKGNELEPVTEQSFVGWAYEESLNLPAGVYTLTVLDRNQDYDIKMIIDGKEAITTVNTTAEWEEPEEPIQGRYVKYDSDEDGDYNDEIMFRILYLDNEDFNEDGEGDGYGGQIIADEVLRVGEIYLGYKDDTIPKNIPDVDGSSSYGTSNFDKAVYSYNNLFDNLNNKCKEALDSLAGDGNALSSGITTRIRNASVSSIDLEDTTNYVNSIGYDFFVNKGYSGKIKRAHWSNSIFDIDHKKCDYYRINKYDLENTPTNADYWLIHRGDYSIAYTFTASNAFFSVSSGKAGEKDILKISNGKGPEYLEVSPCGVRPIVVLEPGVLQNAIDNNQGEGTVENPYLLTKIK